ncbi:MAG: hypothetical protein Q8S73_34185 [Deltaproteobacteria bacterium]|nr:hypothetical protein [Deltaproteobacteria bacterium]
MDIEEYVRQRDAALNTLDMEWAAQQMPYSAPEVRLLAMHKARYEAVNIAPELRHESAEWLHAAGCTRLDGSPLLSAGELPA